MFPNVLVHSIWLPFQCCFLLPPHPEGGWSFGAGWQTLVWAECRWSRERMAKMDSRRGGLWNPNQIWAYPVVSPFPPSQRCTVHTVEESEEGRRRTVWGSPERSRRRCGVTTNPQLVGALPRPSAEEGGRWEAWQARSFLVPLPLEHCGDDCTRQGLIMDQSALVAISGFTAGVVEVSLVSA